MCRREVEEHNKDNLLC